MPKMLAQPLDVGDQMPGRVLDQAGARPAAAAAALIEHHDAVVMRVEELPRALVRAGARAAVQEHRRLAGRVAAFLVIDLVDVRDPQIAVPIRLDAPDRARGAASRRAALVRGGIARASWPRAVDFGGARRDGFLVAARRGVTRDLDSRGLFLLHRLSSLLGHLSSSTPWARAAARPADADAGDTPPGRRLHCN